MADTSMGAGARAGASASADTTVAREPGRLHGELLRDEDTLLPRLVLHEDAISSNLRVMADYVSAAGAVLAPHAKTHMSRELVDRQRAHGAWGFTAATPRQVLQLAEWRVPRILLANPVVDRDAAALLIDRVLVPGGPELFSYADSPAAVDRLAEIFAGLSADAPRLNILVESGFDGGRSGARTLDTAIETMRRVVDSPVLALAGASAFEGLMPGGVDGDGVYPAGAVELLQRTRASAEHAVAQGWIEGTPVLSAGGSSYPDLVITHLGSAAAPDALLVLRSGCYLTHDHGMYRRTSPLGLLRGTDQLRPAFELHASVLSVPEPGLAIVGFGRREAPTDDRMPVLLSPTGEPVPEAVAAIVAVNDHHAFLRFDPRGDAAIQPVPGRVYAFGISHPCGAFDRWRRIPVIDRAGAVVSVVSPVL